MVQPDLMSDSGSEQRITIQVCDGGEPYELELYPNCALKDSGLAGTPGPDEIAKREKEWRKHGWTRSSHYPEVHDYIRPKPVPLMPAEVKQTLYSNIYIDGDVHNSQVGTHGSKQNNAPTNVGGSSKPPINSTFLSGKTILEGTIAALLSAAVVYAVTELLRL
jgi:hypothetical protein